MSIGLALVIPGAALAVEVGHKAPGFEYKDSAGKTWKMSDFKTKVLMIWYEGAASKEQNRRWKKILKKLWDADQPPKSLWKSVGVANFQEHWAPNSLIRKFIQKEVEETKATILCDYNGSMRQTWGMRNGRSNIVVLDKDRKVRWFSSGPLSKERFKQLVYLVHRLVKE